MDLYRNTKAARLYVESGVQSQPVALDALMGPLSLPDLTLIALLQETPLYLIRSLLILLRHLILNVRLVPLHVQQPARKHHGYDRERVSIALIDPGHLSRASPLLRLAHVHE